MNHSTLIFSTYIISALGSCLTIALIFFDYYKKTSADIFQRRLLLSVLCAAFIAVIADCGSRFFAAAPGAGSGDSIRGIYKAGISLFLIAQNCAYYLGVVFIDYFAYKSTERSKKIIVAAVIFLTLYFASVIANLPLGFYFFITEDSLYVPGNLRYLGFALTYGFIPLIIIDVLLSLKYFKHSQAYFLALFVLIICTGAAMEITLDASLTWPCFTAAILYLYFFILRSEAKIDSLTGIDNRASFNEYIEKLSRQNVKAGYSIVMIDIDKFKEINDTLGHLEGDNALRDLAGIIKGLIRHSDFVARYGGDEFIIAAKAEYNIQRVMERIQNAIDQQNVRRIRPYQLYISYGYGIYTVKSGKSIYAFLTEIDALMYKQKDERKKRGLPSAITGLVMADSVTTEKLPETGA